MTSICWVDITNQKTFTSYYKITAFCNKHLTMAQLSHMLHVIKDKNCNQGFSAIETKIMVKLTQGVNSTKLFPPAPKVCVPVFSSVHQICLLLVKYCVPRNASKSPISANADKVDTRSQSYHFF